MSKSFRDRKSDGKYQEHRFGKYKGKRFKSDRQRDTLDEFDPEFNVKRLQEFTKI